ncbi:hypothetical protein [Streptomyces sp. NRRL S-813]|nr:hypothetical protein [Streptomyces sp. NRRL S-813]
MESFEKHPDAEITTGFPGLSALSGARVFASNRLLRGLVTTSDSCR